MVRAVFFSLCAVVAGYGYVGSREGCGTNTPVTILFGVHVPIIRYLVHVFSLVELLLAVGASLNDLCCAVRWGLQGVEVVYAVLCLSHVYSTVSSSAHKL